ncbi:MAG: hypothetical protein D6805_09130 [Planctomycetota bacterium]|nr:MAG: hypothetical protein D6805_09130 [Planctomycetota bacterium]
MVKFLKENLFYHHNQIFPINPKTHLHPPAEASPMKPDKKKLKKLPKPLKTKISPPKLKKTTKTKELSSTTLSKKLSKTNLAHQLSKASKEKKDLLEQHQQELAKANKIQFNLLPEQIPKVPGIDIRVHYQSSKEVGGDYYDFIPVSPEHLGIVVADVSGKGIPAAMVMAMTRASLRLLARKILSPKETLIRVNKFLAKDIRGMMFVTLIYMILHIHTKEILICNAGHNPLLFKGEDGVQIINPPGIAVGLDLGERFNEILQEQSLTLQPGDRILAYTDGVTEAMNENEEEFGEEPLVEIIEKYHNKKSQKFLNILIEAITQHQGNAEQHDDITILTMYRKR